MRDPRERIVRRASDMRGYYADGGALEALIAAAGSAGTNMCMAMVPLMVIITSSQRGGGTGPVGSARPGGVTRGIVGIALGGPRGANQRLPSKRSGTQWKSRLAPMPPRRPSSGVRSSSRSATRWRTSTSRPACLRRPSAGR